MQNWCAMMLNERVWLAVAFFVFLQACTSQPIPQQSSKQNRELLAQGLSGVAVLGHAVSAEDLPDTNILAIDAEMRAFVKRYVDSSLNESSKTSNLLRAIVSPGILGLQYGEDDTGTAQQTFYSGSANCVAFSNLFVAMAREAGLKAYYQDVLVTPNWDLSADELVFRRHVNVLVKVSRRKEQIIDFSRDQETMVELEATRISDKQAFAQYFNNIAIEHLQARHYKESFLYVRKALDLDPRSSFIWSNLGVILSRVDALDQAEAALLHAVELNPSERTALANLVAMYKSRGDQKRADYYVAQIERYRLKNPYFLLTNARSAYAEDDFAKTLDILRRAIKIKPDEALFFELKSRSLAKLGETHKAIKAMEKAIDFAKTMEQRDDYSKQLSEL